MTSLDEKHQEMLNKFHENERKTIPKLKKEIIMLEQEKSKYKDNQIDKILDIDDKIIELKSEIKLLKKEKNQYLLDNSKYIFDYFESKKQLSSGDQNQNIKV